MSHADWRTLIADFVARRIGATEFHDRFLAAWRRSRDARIANPAPVDDLFYQLEAFSPDPSLRDARDPTEADLLSGAQRALSRLDADRSGDVLT